MQGPPCNPVREKGFAALLRWINPLSGACVCVLLVYFASGTHDFCWGFPHLHPVPCPHLSSPVLLCPVVWPPWPTRWSQHHASKLLFWLLPLAGTSCPITKSWFCFKAEQKYHLPLCLPEPPQAKLSPPVLPNTRVHSETVALGEGVCVLCAPHFMGSLGVQSVPLSLLSCKM